MSESFATLELYDLAYKYELEHANLKDSLMDSEAHEQIAFYQTLYETQNKEREIRLLKNEQELNELQLSQKNILLQRSRLRITILMFTLIISMLGASLLVMRNRQKRMRLIDEQKINSQREQLKAVLRTQEEERIRFARDLHDGLGQMLTALKINLSHGACNNGDANIVNTLIKDMHQEIRNISFNIMPHLLVQKGLIPALHQLACKINASGNQILLVTEHEVKHRFDPAVEIAVYRIIQELLNNIFKYSNATRVNVQLIQHKNELNIHVEDDGMGFDISKLEKGSGAGWKNICSRLRFIEGKIIFDSLPGRRNSTVIIDIPIQTR
jgi:two-component system, NarL family, sensor kinase